MVSKGLNERRTFEANEVDRHCGIPESLRVPIKLCVKMEMGSRRFSCLTSAEKANMKPGSGCKRRNVRIEREV